MDLEQIKKGLVLYKGYKTTNDPELKIIEDSIFQSISVYFRPIIKDISICKDKKNVDKSLTLNLFEKELSRMKQVSEKYYINELVVYFMSNAHNEWILEHKKQLKNNNMKNPEKFVPLELLTDKELKEYISVAKPIFEKLGIDFDEKEVEKVFNKNQLVYMIKNEIFTEEDYIEKIRNFEQLNPGIIEKSSDNNNQIQDLLSKKDVMNNIVNAVKQRSSFFNILDKFKEVLKQNNNVGYMILCKGEKTKFVYKFSDRVSQKKIGFKKHVMPKLEKPITRAVHQLARLGGVVFAKNVKTRDYTYHDYSNNSCQFIEYKDCSEEQKRAIDRRERKLKRFSNKINRSRNADTPGIVTMVIVRKELELPKQKNSGKKVEYKQRKTEVIQIPITKRELAEVGVLPEEVGWEKEIKARIYSSDKTVYVAPINKSHEKNDFINSLRVNKNKIVNESNIDRNMRIDYTREDEKEI